MNYRLTQHARLRMAERGVPQSLLETVLENPMQVVPEKDGKVAYQSQVALSGKTFLIRLIVDDSLSPVTVVTIIKTTRINQYWRQ